MAPAQVADVLFLPRRQLARWLEPNVAGLLEAGLAALLSAADFIDSAVEELDHVVPVDGPGGRSRSYPLCDRDRAARDQR